MGIKMDGKALADKICANLKNRCDELKNEGKYPRLFIITTGDDAASKVYVRNKIKRCKEIGIEPVVKHYDYLTMDEYAKLYTTTKAPIIIQEPIAGEVSHNIVAKTLNPHIDVDGFSLINVAMLATGNEPYNSPCTPHGVMRLLSEYNVKTEGKNALVIGRSNIVGRPMATMLEQAGCTVTIAHSKTHELQFEHLILNSDIIVSAVGKRNVGGMDAFVGVPIGKGKTIIDVGMNRDENGKLCGDFSEKLKQCFDFYTPTPGGTGPLTVAMLMENTIKYYEGKR